MRRVQRLLRVAEGRCLRSRIRQRQAMLLSQEQLLHIRDKTRSMQKIPMCMATRSFPRKPQTRQVKSTHNGRELEQGSVSQGNRDGAEDGR